MNECTQDHGSRDKRGISSVRQPRDMLQTKAGLIHRPDLSQQGQAVSTESRGLSRMCTHIPPARIPQNRLCVVFHGKCKIGASLPTPYYIEADEIHRKVESGQGSYFISEQLGSFFVRRILHQFQQSPVFY